VARGLRSIAGVATSLAHRLLHLADTFLDVLLPRTCAACREIVEEPEPICSRCAAALSAMPIPEPFPALVPHGPPVIVQALFPFAGPARELVHALKYQGRRDVARPIAKLAAARFGPGLSSGTLVPIPLHPRRERARGYNQSAVLAAAIAEATGARLLPALIRTRSTRSQTKLGRGARAGNVAGAFRLAGEPILEPRTVVLVDDVVTTGATLGAAAVALAGTEILQIRALAAAHEL
jgi:ComF family protein